MNAPEPLLEYPLADRLPAYGETLPIAPGVHWIRMDLPFALDHVNLWLMEDEIDGPRGPIKGWSVIDCCVSLEQSRAQWERVLATQLDGLPILRVIVTHMHPDHIGLAHWLCERWSGRGDGPAPAAHVPGHECRLWISAADYSAARISSQSTAGFGGESAAEFFAAHGLTDPDSLEKIRQRAGYYPSMVPCVPASFHRLLDGMTVRIGQRAWRCISGYGHSPEHIALYCADTRVLISGDMLLPRISTNVSVYDVEPEANPLALFLESIDKFRALPADTLVLPSHGKPFTGLHARIGQLHEHHRERLAEVLTACTEQPRSAADILPLLFKRALDLHQTTFAMGESAAHLHLLWFAGQLRRTHGADGIYRFAA